MHKIPWKHRNSAEMGKFRGSAQNSTLSRKLWSLNMSTNKLCSKWWRSILRSRHNLVHRHRTRRVILYSVQCGQRKMYKKCSCYLDCAQVCWGSIQTPSRLLAGNGNKEWVARQEWRRSDAADICSDIQSTLVYTVSQKKRANFETV